MVGLCQGDQVRGGSLASSRPWHAARFEDYSPLTSGDPERTALTSRPDDNAPDAASSERSRIVSARGARSGNDLPALGRQFASQVPQRPHATWGVSAPKGPAIRRAAPGDPGCT